MTELLTLERLREYVTDCAAEIIDSDDMDRAIDEIADGSEYVIYPRHHAAMLLACEQMGIDLDDVWAEWKWRQVSELDTWSNLLTQMAYGSLATLLRSAVVEERGLR